MPTGLGSRRSFSCSHPRNSRAGRQSKHASITAATSFFVRAPSQLHVKSHPTRGQVNDATERHLIEQVVFMGQIILQPAGQSTAQSPVQVTVHPPAGQEQAPLHVQLPAEQIFGGA